jgi:hypothetical protein
MQYGNSKFPTSEFIKDIADRTVQMLPIHASMVDGQNDLTPHAKARLKLILAVWGDKTVASSMVKGSEFVGGVNKAFLAELGLASIQGMAKVEAVPVEVFVNQDKPPAPDVHEPPVVITPKQRNYDRQKRDIAAWYAGDSELAYSADYRKWILEFVRDAIDWQSEGIPAHLAAERLREQANVYIVGQSQSAQTDRAIIKFEKTSETHLILHALSDYEYYGGWMFTEAPYYQLKLANWLEKNKVDIKMKVCNSVEANQQWPIVKWCLAVEYLVSQIMGRKLDTKNDETLARSLFSENEVEAQTTHYSSKWTDVVQYVKTNNAKFKNVKSLLTESSKTFMGSISGYRVSHVQFYRALEIAEAMQELRDCSWDLLDSLPTDTKNSIVLSPADVLKELYPRVNAIVTAEANEAKSIKEKIKVQLGGEITEESLVSTLSTVSDLFIVFNANRIQYKNEFKTKFDVAPLDHAKKILGACKLIDQAIATENRVDKLQLLAANPVETLNVFLSDLLEIERLSLKEKDSAENEMKRITGGTDLTGMVEQSVKYLSGLIDKIEKLEVISDVNEQN